MSGIRDIVNVFNRKLGDGWCVLRLKGTLRRGAIARQLRDVKIFNYEKLFRTFELAYYQKKDTNVVLELFTLSAFIMRFIDSRMFAKGHNDKKLLTRGHISV